MTPGYNPPDYMLDPPDDVEDGDILFDDDGPEPLSQEELDEEAAFWFNRPGSDGFAPADFVYDPLSRKGFE